MSGSGPTRRSSFKLIDLVHVVFRQLKVEERQILYDPLLLRRLWNRDDAMPAITQKMLTQQLRKLEKDGIVNRISYNEVPPRVEYELSEYGMSLRGILDSLCAWGERHIIKEYGDKSAVARLLEQLNA